MNFPWKTKQQRLAEKRDEEFARRQIAEFHRQYRGHFDAANRATDREINEAMQDIIRRRAAVNILRLERRKGIREENCE